MRLRKLSLMQLIMFITNWVYSLILLRSSFVTEYQDGISRVVTGRRLWYNLTPVGIAEKAKMTLEYMKWSLTNYQDIRQRVRVVCRKLKQDSKESWPKGPGFGYPQRGFLLCWKFIELLKLQISNYKYQTISNDQNSKIQTMSRPGMFWSLNIGI